MKGSREEKSRGDCTEVMVGGAGGYFILYKMVLQQGEEERNERERDAAQRRWGSHKTTQT